MPRKKVDTAVEAIRTNMEKERPKNHPIKEHPLSECDEYIRKLYIDALCVVAQYETEDAEKSLNFVRRVHAGAGLTNDFTEHIKNAMEITVERFEEFIAQCRENKLENIFFVDALIAACADGAPNSKQVDFISEIADALRISKKNVGYLSGLAASILEQSAEKYHAACDNIEKENRWALVRNIVCYVKEFVSGVIIDCDEILWIYSKEMTELKYFDIERDNEGKIDDVKSYNNWSNHKEVIVENQKILWYDDFDDPYFHKFTSKLIPRFSIDDCESFTLKNCYSERNFSFTNVINVDITKCKFDFSYRKKDNTLSHVFWLEGINTFKFSESSISNLWIAQHIDYYNAVFRICSDDMSLSLSKSHFSNIRKVDRYNGFIICSENKGNRYSYKCYEVRSINIEECSFCSCSGDEIEYSQMVDGGLHGCLKLKNNTIQNCCKM